MRDTAMRDTDSYPIGTELTMLGITGRITARQIAHDIVHYRITFSWGSHIWASAADVRAAIHETRMKFTDNEQGE